MFNKGKIKGWHIKEANSGFFYMINYSGLRKKESYNEILNYIQTDQPTVKYPNRKATF